MYTSSHIYTRVFRKTTHTDQYLNFNSNHPLEHKRGVVRTLTHRARSIVSDLGERNDELKHVRTALGYNGYPDWILAETREEVKEIRREEELTSGVKREERKKRPVIIPYIRGFSEELKRIFWRIRSTGILQTLKHSTTVAGTPKRSSREGQSGWPSI